MDKYVRVATHPAVRNRRKILKLNVSGCSSGGTRQTKTDLKVVFEKSAKYIHWTMVITFPSFFIIIILYFYTTSPNTFFFLQLVLRCIATSSLGSSRFLSGSRSYSSSNGNCSDVRNNNDCLSDLHWGVVLLKWSSDLKNMFYILILFLTEINFTRSIAFIKNPTNMSVKKIKYKLCTVCPIEGSK